MALNGIWTTVMTREQQDCNDYDLCMVHEGLDCIELDIGDNSDKAIIRIECEGWLWLTDFIIALHRDVGWRLSNVAV